MLFNSPEFLLFFVIVYLVYRLTNLVAQNLLLLIASYFFYGYWDYRFLILIFISTTLDFLISNKIYHCDSKEIKKLLICFSISANLLILFLFKYFNFFVQEANLILSNFNLELFSGSLDIVLPVGISFYTFQTMSYSLDVYKEKINPEKNFCNFALYVCFFPQLVAGPIERANKLLPQIKTTRQIDHTKIFNGFNLFIWGLFKKIVIADLLGKTVNAIYDSNLPHSGGDYLLATFFYSWQIFCDFSGYTDIARGSAKIMGFDLSSNFNLPYFSKNPSEFWKRWHITLSNWLKDYLYVPLGGSKRSPLFTIRNLIITMTLGGLWHGSSLNFIIWGTYNGVLLVLHKFFIENKNSKPKSPLFAFSSIILTYSLFLFGWMIFRSNDLSEILVILSNVGTLYELNTLNIKFLQEEFFYIFLLLVLQILNFNDIKPNILTNKVFRIILNGILFGYIIFKFEFLNSKFIYFQF